MTIIRSNGHGGEVWTTSGLSSVSTTLEETPHKTASPEQLDSYASIAETEMWDAAEDAIKRFIADMRLELEMMEIALGHCGAKSLVNGFPHLEDTLNADPEFAKHQAVAAELRDIAKDLRSA